MRGNESYLRVRVLLLYYISILLMGLYKVLQVEPSVDQNLQSFYKAFLFLGLGRFDPQHYLYSYTFLRL